MIGIIFATQMEAAPFFAKTGATQVSEHPFPLYQVTLPGNTMSCFVVICGIGRVKAALAAQMLIREYLVRWIINAGICGAVADGIEVGTVFRIEETLDSGRLESGLKPKPVKGYQAVWKGLKTAKLITTDTPVFDPDTRKKMARLFDLVDMEGAAVAETAALYSISCSLIKGVSDLADNDSRKDLFRNIAEVSDKIARALIDGLLKSDYPGSPDGRSERSAGRTAQGLFKKMLRFTKIEHTAFSFPLLFTGAWLGAGGRFPQIGIFLLILIAAVGARVFGMAFNRIFDRRLDALNPRTASRELPSGMMTTGDALAVALAGLTVYISACAGLGGWCLKLSPLPLVPLLGYSLLKRFTSLCHFGIGICMAIAPVGAFVAAAQNLRFNSAIILFSLFVFCWMSGSDIIYALLDIESDRKNGIYSLPAKLGPAGAQAVAAAVHLLAVASLVVVLLVTGGGQGAWIFTALGTVAFIMMYLPFIPVQVRFFPISTVASISGAVVPMLGGVLS